MIYDDSAFLPGIILSFCNSFPATLRYLADAKFWCKYKYDQRPCKEL